MTAVAVERHIDPEYLCSVVRRLSSIGSSPLGFRVAGTPEDRRAAAFVAGEFRRLGLADVELEPVPVDAWRFREAFVELGSQRYECASMGGVPGTGSAGVSGPLAVVHRGGRRELEGVDVAGKVVLVDWSDEELWPYAFGLELGLRGASAVIVACLPGGPYFQRDGALGSFDAMWHGEAPPVVTIRKEDALALWPKAGSPVRLVLGATLREAWAANVIGVLPGRRRGRPLLVGAHHDGWFRAAHDNATGVALLLGLARALTLTGHRPEHPIAFVSHTAEEYGLARSRFDWCYGSWYGITQARRAWSSRVPFYLNLEGCAGPGQPLSVDAPPELERTMRTLCRRAQRDGLLRHGFTIDPPSPLTDVWPHLAAGIPGVNVSTFTDEVSRETYHTQLDTPETLDPGYLADLGRVFLRILLTADAGPDEILDYGARSAHLRRSLAALPRSPARRRVEEAALALAERRGRQAFTAVGRGLHGLDASGAAAYPHVQPANDLRRLEEALAALRAGRLEKAASALAGVGLNALCSDLSRAAFARERGRTSASAARATWAAQGRLDPGPDLWNELASLRSEPGAMPPEPWLEQRLEREAERARRALERRLLAMASALEGRAPPLPSPRTMALPCPPPA
ncbi:MAG: M28 family peptidase [Gaiellales bacterium]